MNKKSLKGYGIMRPAVFSYVGLQRCGMLREQMMQILTELRLQGPMGPYKIRNNELLVKYTPWRNAMRRKGMLGIQDTREYKVRRFFSVDGKPHKCPHHTAPTRLPTWGTVSEELDNVGIALRTQL